MILIFKILKSRVILMVFELVNISGECDNSIYLVYRISFCHFVQCKTLLQSACLLNMFPTFQKTQNYVS